MGMLLLMQLEPTTIHMNKVEVRMPWPCATKPHDTVFYVTVLGARCPHGHDPMCSECSLAYSHALETCHGLGCKLPRHHCGCPRRLTPQSLDAVPHLLWANVAAPHVVAQFAVEPVVDARDADREFVATLKAVCTAQWPLWSAERPPRPRGEWCEVRAPRGLEDATWRMMDTRSGAPAALPKYASHFVGRARAIVDATPRVDASECPHIRPKTSSRVRRA